MTKYVAMPKLLPQHVVDEIRQRVAAGECRAQVAREMGLAKATVNAKTSDLVFVDYGTPAKRAERAKGQRRSPESRQKIAAFMRRYRKEHPVDMRKLVDARQVAFTKVEAGYLSVLETEYGPLKHAKIGCHWFDFVGNRVVIETTEDWGKGVTSATNRFRTISNGSRQLVLFCPSKNVGRVRLQRLASLGVSVRDIQHLHEPRA